MLRGKRRKEREERKDRSKRGVRSRSGIARRRDIKTYKKTLARRLNRAEKNGKTSPSPDSGRESGRRLSVSLPQERDTNLQHEKEIKHGNQKENENGKAKGKGRTPPIGKFHETLKCVTLNTQGKKLSNTMNQKNGIGHQHCGSDKYNTLYHCFFFATCGGAHLGLASMMHSHRQCGLGPKSSTPERKLSQGRPCRLPPADTGP